VRARERLGLCARESGFKVEDGLNGSGITETRFDGRRAKEAIEKMHA